MTTNLMKNTNPPDVQPAEAQAFAIGEIDTHVFTCPSCARPLAGGANKCPGCGVYLILGVRLKRAGAILALGVALGVLIGGVGTAAAITLSSPAAQAAVTPSATTRPSAPPASALPSFVYVDPGAPQAAISALSGTAVVNGRIAVDAQTLASTLARSNATTSEIARALRSLSADATLGIDLVGRLAPWPEAADTQTGLDGFYRSMAEAAKAGLRASLADARAYRRAGNDMLEVLAQLGPIDAQSRTLAETIALELPPVVLPPAISR